MGLSEFYRRGAPPERLRDRVSLFATSAVSAGPKMNKVLVRECLNFKRDGVCVR